MRIAPENREGTYLCQEPNEGWKKSGTTQGLSRSIRVMDREGDYTGENEGGAEKKSGVREAVDHSAVFSGGRSHTGF